MESMINLITNVIHETNYIDLARLDRSTFLINGYIGLSYEKNPLPSNQKIFEKWYSYFAAEGNKNRTYITSDGR